MVERVQLNPNQTLNTTQAANSTRPSTQAPKTSFAETLEQTQNVRFSNHAQKRLQNRNISMTDDSMERLSNAVDKAEKRGGRSSLVMVDDLAFIVNVKDRLVVTAMDTNNRGEGVFTQIDSVVFADPTTAKAEPAQTEKDQ
jgi:flagellar operon protein